MSGLSKERKNDNPYDQSMSYFLLGSLGVFSTGVLAGVFIAMRHLREKENFHFNFRQHRTPAIMATQALVYGSALALGTFGVAGAAFCYTNDIRNVNDFDHFMRRNLEPFQPPVSKDPIVIRERELVDKLDESKQLEYVWKKYFEDEAQVVKHIPDDGDSPPPLEPIPEENRTIVQQLEYIKRKYISS